MPSVHRAVGVVLMTQHGDTSALALLRHLRCSADTQRVRRLPRIFYVYLWSSWGRQVELEEDGSPDRDASIKVQYNDSKRRSPVRATPIPI